ncbi:hypothetical protein [Singulisphaera sp. PoT]|uniref:hypothetical protein n=1 Tax=Singulisphaera sp. PoT TaxID=3411797 RepID=UPI003BF4A83B
MDDVDRADIESHALQERTRFGTASDDPQVSGGEASEWSVVVTALHAGPNFVGMTDLDPAAAD